LRTLNQAAQELYRESRLWRQQCAELRRESRLWREQCAEVRRDLAVSRLELAARLTPRSDEMRSARKQPRYGHDNRPDAYRTARVVGGGTAGD
jgi:hypothetical protein